MFLIPVGLISYPHQLSKSVSVTSSIKCYAFMVTNIAFFFYVVKKYFSIFAFFCIILEIIMIYGIFSVLFGVFLYFMYRNTKSTTHTIANVVPTPFNELKELLNSGETADNLKCVAEIEGTITDKNYVLAPFSNTKCVYFTELEREKYQEKYYTMVNNRKRVAWRTKYNILSNRSKGICFEVVSADGDKVLVDPSQAELPLVKTFQTFIPKSKSIGHDMRILGIEKNEKSLKVGSSVYVVGELKNNDGSLIISKSEDKSIPMVISGLSKDKYLNGQHFQKWFFLVLSILLTVIGTALIVVKYFKDQF